MKKKVPETLPQLIHTVIQFIDDSTPNGKTRVIELLYPAIACSKDPEMYLIMLGTALDIPHEILKASLPRSNP